MTTISLFDGSGGFPLAATICGMIPLYASEIEPYPIAVTRSRFPQMTHLGDVSRVNGAELTPADVITFGSPCQDLSVAGKREGLRHTDNGDEETTRSGLFMEAVRIITEMRKATNGRFPRFAVWENVPGAFSSSNGDDFLAVLTALAKIADPEVSIPKSPKWSNAGEIVGDGWSLAWRVLDAQYFGKTVRDGDTGDVLVRGTPQRRRRIFLVADLVGQRAGEVLLERNGLPWNYPPCNEPWQTASADAEGSVGTDDRARVFGISAYESNAMKSSNPHSGIYEADTSRTLDLNGGNPACNQGGMVVVEAAAGLLDRNSADARSIGYEDEKAPTIRESMTPSVVCLQGSMIGRADKNGPQGDGINEDVCFTLNTTDRHAVVESALFENHSQDTRFKGPLDVSPMLPAQLGTGGNNTPFVVESYQKVTGPLMANSHPGSYCGQDAYSDMLICSSGDVAGTLDASYYKGCGERQGVVRKNYIVRRLTPTECARLQGFPDEWGHPDYKEDFTDEEYTFWLGVRNTYAKINDKPVKDYTKAQMLTWYNKLHTDSAEYKMWGNGVNLPCVTFVMKGIADILREGESDA